MSDHTLPEGHIDRQAFQELLEAEILRLGSVANLAKDLNISRTFLYNVRAGHNTPGPKIEKRLGYRRVVTVSYEPINPEKPREEPKEPREDHGSFI